MITIFKKSEQEIPKAPTHGCEIGDTFIGAEIMEVNISPSNFIVGINITTPISVRQFSGTITDKTDYALEINNEWFALDYDNKVGTIIKYSIVKAKKSDVDKKDLPSLDFIRFIKDKNIDLLKMSMLDIERQVFKFYTGEIDKLEKLEVKCESCNGTGNCGGMPNVGLACGGCYGKGYIK